MTHQLKSLAHPDWPYAGSPHEWRGFVKNEKQVTPIVTSAPRLTSGGTMYHDRGVAGRVIDIYAEPIYQKQNFGPELK